MRDRIEVEKEQLPYTFDIVLGAENYSLTFKYNSACDMFTCTLSKNGEVQVYDEPLIYGVPLFIDVYNSSTFPVLTIVPYDESQAEQAITWNNFGTKVFLTIDDEG